MRDFKNPTYDGPDCVCCKSNDASDELGLLNDREREFVESYTQKIRAQERERLVLMLKPHLEVCNYRHVTGEDCDVCHWVSTTIADIQEDTGVSTPSENGSV